MIHGIVGEADDVGLDWPSYRHRHRIGQRAALLIAIILPRGLKARMFARLERCLARPSVIASPSAIVAIAKRACVPPISTATSSIRARRYNPAANMAEPPLFRAIGLGLASCGRARGQRPILHEDQAQGVARV